MLSFKKPSTNQGFTLVELMIATAVFSVILLLVVNSFIQIGRIYYKGLTISRTQETARAISDELTQSLKFSKSRLDVSPANPAGGQSYCIGLVRYSYVLGKQIDPTLSDDNHTPHALVRDTTLGGSCTPLDLNNVPELSGSFKTVELLSEKMTLNYLSIEQQNDIYKVSVVVSYGDADLFASGTTQDKPECSAEATKGLEFCAVAIYNSSVFRRLD
jgi:prepilin-type N-terminal cleavage/methylation domain-containing protein